MTITVLGISLKEDGTAIINANFELKYPSHCKGITVLNNIRTMLFEEEITPKVEKKVRISALQEPKNNPKVEIVQKKIKALAPKVKVPGKSRQGIPGWSDEEMLLIQDIPEWGEAVKVYKKMFPGKRSDNAIGQQSKKIQKGIVKKRSPPVFSGKSTSPANPDTRSFKTNIKNSVNPPHEPMIQGAEDLEDQMPEEPTASRADLRPGVRVKQTGGTKICAGIGTVKRCPNGKDEVLVAFDKGMEWMERKNLTLVSV